MFLPTVQPSEGGQFGAVRAGGQVAPGALGVHEVEDAVFGLACVEGVKGKGEQDEEK